MPAAAVIPAPIAYIKVVAVKKLVVGFRSWASSVRRNGVHWLARPSCPETRSLALTGWRLGVGIVYFEKIRVFKAGLSPLNTLAWDNGIGLWSYFVGFRDRSND